MAPSSTPFTYATPSDVQAAIFHHTSFDQNIPTTDFHGQIVNAIRRAEGEFERRSGTAFRPRWVEDEVHSMEAMKTRHPQLFEDSTLTYKYVNLNNKPIVPFDTNRGHKIEVYEGSSDANLDWTDWATDKTQGRGNDYWVDEKKGFVNVRKTFVFRRQDLFRFTYEWGKPIATLGSNVSQGSTSAITLSQSGHSKGDTYRYPARGLIRIGNEYITYDGKSTTQLGTNWVLRGQLSTDDVAHSSGDEVYHVPDDVRGAVAAKAAAEFMSNERFVSILADEGVNIESSVQRLDEQWEAVFDRYQRMELIA